MGASGYTVSVVPIDGAVQLGLDELYEEIWYWIEQNIRHMVKGKAYNQVLWYYLGEVAGDGGPWEHPEPSLAFMFSDAAGCCGMSSVACQHWFRLSFAAMFDSLQLVAKKFGYTLEKVDDIPFEDLLSSCPEYPLVVVNKKLYYAAAQEDGYEIWTDDDSDVLSYAELSSAQKRRVRKAVDTPECPCPMCKKFRAGKSPLDPKGGRSLETPGREFTTLGKALRFPQYAEEIYIYEQHLYELPAEIGTLQKLRTLWMWDNAVSELPDAFCGLSALEELHLGRNPLEELPEDFGKLSSLRSLDIGYSYSFRRLPESMGALQALQKLDLSSTKVSTLPESFGALTQLRELNIQGTQLVPLPKVLQDLSGLVSLNLSSLKGIDEQLMEWPFAHYPLLEQLELVNLSLKQIPAAIFRLPLLKILGMHSNALTSIPEELSVFHQLESLSFGSNQIKTLPTSLFQNTTLRSLNLSDNQIEFIPEEVGLLRQLDTLYLGENPLKELPDSIGELKELTWLDLSETKLTSLPASLARLPKLETLSLQRVEGAKEMVEGLKLRAAINVYT